MRVPLYLLTDARVCSLRPCYVARVSATLPLVEEVNYACATIVFYAMHKLQIVP